jgi:hypothetical protein
MRPESTGYFDSALLDFFNGIAEIWTKTSKTALRQTEIDKTIFGGMHCKAPETPVYGFAFNLHNITERSSEA